MNDIVFYVGKIETVDDFVDIYGVSDAKLKFKDALNLKLIKTFHVELLVQMFGKSLTKEVVELLKSDDVDFVRISGILEVDRGGKNRSDLVVGKLNKTPPITEDYNFWEE